MNEITFSQFVKALRAHVSQLTAQAPQLFEVQLDKDALWQVYLTSFPEGTNEVYRKRLEFDCSACRHFVKDLGAMVTIENGELKTIWGFSTGDSKYQQVVDALDAFVKHHPLAGIFVSKESKFGIQKDHETTPEGVRTWEHMNAEIPSRLAYRGAGTLDGVKAKARAIQHVFLRSLEEISDEGLGIVLELIGQKSLYKGEEWAATLQKFKQYKEQFKLVPDEKRLAFSWTASVEAGPVVGKIKNHSIGTLLVDLSEGRELEEAIRRYEAVVAPANYKRPQAIFTQKMLKDAQKELEAQGLLPALGRRFARVDDIRANNVLYVNRDAAIKDAGIFAEMSRGAPVNPKQFTKIEEIGIEQFISGVLPTATKVEALFEHRLASNLVSLIAPTDPEAPTLFKWGNGFSWAYSGNVADSMKERVKAAGGNVEGVLRFSIQWNEDGRSRVDLDAHARGPRNMHISFQNKRPGGAAGSGFLDVDMINPPGVGVENISWPLGSTLTPGVYKFQVHNFSGHRQHDGFDAEIEFGGSIYHFSHREAFVGTVDVAEVTVSQDQSMEVRSLLKETTRKVGSQQVWGLGTNLFHPVIFCAHSPNFWDAQDGIGHKHYMFMLKGCINDESPNGFFNEYLREEFMKHKRVFEALGKKLAPVPADDQLSGLGFSSTKNNHLIVRVEGYTSRTLKILF